jgi:hypothetical protein
MLTFHLQLKYHAGNFASFGTANNTMNNPRPRMAMNSSAFANNSSSMAGSTTNMTAHLIGGLNLGPAAGFGGPRPPPMAGLGSQPSAPTRMGQQQAAPTRMSAQPVLGTSPNMSSHHPGPAAGSGGTGTSNYSRAIFDAQVSFKKCTSNVFLAPSPLISGMSYRTLESQCHRLLSLSCITTP